MVKKGTTAAVLLLSLSFTVATAQEHPFLFTMTPPDEAGRGVVVHYDAAYGRETFEPLGGDNLEQTLGIRARLGTTLLLTGRLAFATSHVSTSTSQHAELLVHAMRSGDIPVDLALGPGFRHEYQGTNVLLGRIIVGRRFESSQLYGNVLLEKPFAADRDDIDVLLTVGWSYSVSSEIRLGFEAVGQDLEGFWDEDEAEGGATLFLGPTAVLAVPSSSWRFTLGAGPILRATTSDRFSSATRDLPFTRENGFVIHASASLGL